MYPQDLMVALFSPGSTEKVDVKEEPMQRSEIFNFMPFGCFLIEQ